jgi:hypothetical protein
MTYLPSIPRGNSAKTGQALVEFMIGMVVVLVLVSGLLQIASICKAHSDTMLDARKEAGIYAMTESGPGASLLFNPDYIKDWQEGGDGRMLTRDDVSVAGDPGSFQRTVVERTVQNPEEWDIIDAVPENRMSALRGDAGVINSLGLVKGSAKKKAQLDMIPAFKHLVYNADSIDVESEVWMTSTKDVY